MHIRRDTNLRLWRRSNTLAYFSLCPLTWYTHRCKSGTYLEQLTLLFVLFAEPASETSTSIAGNTSAANMGGNSGGGSVRPMAVQHSNSAAGATDLGASPTGKPLLLDVLVFVFPIWFRVVAIGQCTSVWHVDFCLVTLLSTFTFFWINNNRTYVYLRRYNPLASQAHYHQS